MFHNTSNPVSAVPYPQSTSLSVTFISDMADFLISLV